MMVFPLVATAVELVAAKPAPGIYESAVAARRNGDPAQAIALLEHWLTVEPRDVDARLQYGLALLDLGRLAEATIAFRAVLEQAPSYDDARIALARIAQRRGDRAGARAALGPVPAGNQEAALLRAQLSAPGVARLALSLDASRTRLSRGQPSWREIDGQVTFTPKPGLALTGRVEASRRFGLNDTYGEGQISARLSPTVSSYVLAGWTPHADYRPQWQVGTGGGLVLRRGSYATSLTLDLRYARYRSGRIATINPGFEQHLFGDRGWFTGQLISVVDKGKASFGVLGRADAQASKQVRLFVGAAHAPDVSEGSVFQTTSMFAGAEMLLGSQASLRLSGSRTVQRVGSNRTQFSFGIGTRF